MLETNICIYKLRFICILKNVSKFIQIYKDKEIYKKKTSCQQHVFILYQNISNK